MAFQSSRMASEASAVAFEASATALNRPLPQWLAPEAANNFSVAISAIPAAHLRAPVVGERFHTKEAAVYPLLWTKRPRWIRSSPRQRAAGRASRPTKLPRSRDGPLRPSGRKRTPKSAGRPRRQSGQRRRRQRWRGRRRGQRRRRKRRRRKRSDERQEGCSGERTRARRCRARLSLLCQACLQRLVVRFRMWSTYLPKKEGWE